MKLARLVALATATFLISCSRQPQERPPEPPLPADTASLDAAIRERIEQRAAAVRRRPRSAPHWRELGMVYHAHNLFDLAAECYGQSRALSPDDPRTHFYLAQVERRLSRLSESVASLRRAGELDPGYVPAHWRLGLWLLEDGDVAAARQALERARALAPTDRAVTLAFARLHLQASEAAAAVELLESYLAARSEDGYAHFLLGGAYRRLGRTEEAEAHLTLGQGAEPGFRDPWTEELDARRAGFSAELGAAIELLGPQPRQAVAKLEALRAGRPGDGTVLINLGIAYRRTGRLEDSLAVLREAVEREPARGLAHLQLAVTCSETGLLAEALQHAERTVELQPTSAKGYAVRGEVLALSGEAEKAVVSLRQASALDASDPTWLHRLGSLLCQQQRWQEAIPVLEDLLRRSGADAEILFLLGAAQANSGRLDDAAVTLERALELRPQDATVRQALEQLERARAEARR